MLGTLIVDFVIYSFGMINFVVLMMHYGGRMLVSAFHKNISSFIGSIFLNLDDDICRIVNSNNELSIGILVLLLDILCIVYLIIKSAYGFGGK